MRKRISFMLLVMLLTSTITGCNQDGNVIVNNKDKTVISSINVKDYENDIDEMTWEDYNEYNIGTIDDSKFIYVKKLKLNDINTLEKVDIKVQVPFIVGVTNGIKVDDHTVIFNTDVIKNKFSNREEDYFIAYILSDTNLTDSSLVKEVKLKGYREYDVKESSKEIKNNGIYDDTLCIYVDAKECFPINVIETYLDKTYTYYPFSDSINITHNKKVDGKHIFQVTVSNNQIDTITFYVDTRKPYIKIKNDKIYGVDKKKDGYASGISYIEVNDKKVINGYSLQKARKIANGRLVKIKVVDNAGNSNVFYHK